MKAFPHDHDHSGKYHFHNFSQFDQVMGVSNTVVSNIVSTCKLSARAKLLI